MKNSNSKKKYLLVNKLNVKKYNRQLHTVSINIYYISTIARHIDKYLDRQITLLFIRISLRNR